MILDSFDLATQKIIENLFDYKDVLEAFRLIEEKKITISFTKGDVSDYFVVSGLVRDTAIFEGRISSKMSGEDKGVQSRCDCPNWSDHKHCPHVISLFIKFILNTPAVKETPQQDFLTRTGAYSANAVFVKEYGTLIERADGFEGIEARGYTTYFAHPVPSDKSKESPFSPSSTFSGAIGC